MCKQIMSKYMSKTYLTYRLPDHTPLLIVGFKKVV
jgi:hypothetical protein